jgi:hypothetical protein
MPNDAENALTFWLGRSVLKSLNAPAQEMVFDDIEG